MRQDMENFVGTTERKNENSTPATVIVGSTTEDLACKIRQAWRLGSEETQEDNGKAGARSLRVTSVEVREEDSFWKGVAECQGIEKINVSLCRGVTGKGVVEAMAPVATLRNLTSYRCPDLAQEAVNEMREKMTQCSIVVAQCRHTEHLVLVRRHT